MNENGNIVCYVVALYDSNNLSLWNIFSLCWQKPVSCFVLFTIVSWHFQICSSPDISVNRTINQRKVALLNWWPIYELFTSDFNYMPVFVKACYSLLFIVFSLRFYWKRVILINVSYVFWCLLLFSFRWTCHNKKCMNNCSMFDNGANCYCYIVAEHNLIVSELFSQFFSEIFIEFRDSECSWFGLIIE